MNAAILNHDVERLVLEPVSSGQGDGVELGGRVPHEGRFQDVTTLPVDLEPSLVHIHVGAGCLEVQRHWGKCVTRHLGEFLPCYESG